MMGESGSEKARSAADSEPDVYELNLEDDSAAPRAEPAKPMKPVKPVKPKAGEGEMYDLAEPLDEPGSPPVRKPVTPDPRLDRQAVPAPAPAPSAGGEGGAAGEGAKGSAAGAKGSVAGAIPKQYQTEAEPAYLDPAVAASKREQARIRAAEQMEVEAAKRRMIRTITLAAAAVVAVIVAVWLALVG